MSFLAGMGYGVATALLLGPVFFTLLKASLEHGSRGGLFVALGIIVSDVVVVLLFATGFGTLLQDRFSSAAMALASGVILAALGLRYLFAPAADPGPQAPSISKHHRPRLTEGALALFMRGFLVNFINPFVFGVWFALFTHAKAEYLVVRDVAFFLSGVLAGVFVSDVAKALLAQRLKPLLSPVLLRKVYASIGIVLLLFAVRTLWHGWTHR